MQGDDAETDEEDDPRLRALSTRGHYARGGGFLGTVGNEGSPVAGPRSPVVLLMCRAMNFLWSRATQRQSSI